MSATFKSCADGEVRQVTLSEVYYAENLLWNIFSYGKIEELGYEIYCDGRKRYVGRRSDTCKVFDVHKDEINVLFVKVFNAQEKKDFEYLTMALAEGFNAPSSDVMSGSLLDFHLRLAVFHTTLLRAWHVTLTMEYVLRIKADMRDMCSWQTTAQ